MEIGERKQKILKAIVEQYIASGEPVGSKTLCDLLDVQVSSATVRNEMADLSGFGFLEQLHTSGGRVPSQKGYRYYIDHLMRPQQYSKAQAVQLRRQLIANGGDPERLLLDASGALAEMTGCVSFYTTAADELDCIQGVELIPAGRRKAMLIMLTTSGVIKSTICRTESDIDEAFKRTFYTVVHTHFIGTPLKEITTIMLQTLAARLGGDVFSLLPVLISLSGLCQEASRSGIEMEGETNLLSRPEWGENLNDMVRFLAHREQFKEMLNTQVELENTPVHVFVGRENPLPELHHAALIFSKYTLNGREGGSLGIIGSLRMDYARRIPQVEMVAGVVGSLLSEAVYEVE